MKDLATMEEAIRLGAKMYEGDHGSLVCSRATIVEVEYSVTVSGQILQERVGSRIMPEFSVNLHLYIR